MSREVVVVSGVRTAIGTYGGSLKDIPPTELAAQVVRESLARASVDGKDVGHVVFGHVLNTEPKDISHDLYALVIKKGNVSEAQEIKVSKRASFAIGLVAVILGIAFEKQNIAFMAALAFGIAAAGNFPVLFLSMYWKGLTTRGALAGGYGGLTAAVVLVLMSKSVWVTVLGNATALFPYDQPALFAMPLAFLLAYVFSVTDQTPRAAKERHAFEDQWVRAQTGFGADGAVSH